LARILALDYGRRRIGVAMSDMLGLTAQPLEVWEESGWEETVRHINHLIESEDVTDVIVGHPLTLHGQRGKMAQETERFVAMLKRHIAIPVILWDERLTSVQARQALMTMKKSVRGKKGRVDILSAVLLLQNYLEYRCRFSADARKGGV